MENLKSQNLTSQIYLQKTKGESINFRLFENSICSLILKPVLCIPFAVLFIRFRLLLLKAENHYHEYLQFQYFHQLSSIYEVSLRKHPYF